MTAATSTGGVRAFGLALALPFVVVTGLAIAAAVSPARLGWAGDLGTLIASGVAGCLAGSLILYRTLRASGVRWIIVVIAYDVVMPLAVIGMALLAVASREGW
jgi:hypothetical protein